MLISKHNLKVRLEIFSVLGEERLGDGYWKGVFGLGRIKEV